MTENEGEMSWEDFPSQRKKNTRTIEMTMIRRRDRLTMKLDILKVLSNGPLKTSHLMRKTGMNYNTLVEVIQEMSDVGCLHIHSNGFCELTTQGVNGVRFFQQAALMVEGRQD